MRSVGFLFAWVASVAGAVAVACSAASPPPEAATVVVVATPPAASSSDEPPLPAPSPSGEANDQRDERDEPGSPGGVVHEFSWSGVISTADGGVQLSFQTSGDAGVSFSATFGADGGVFALGGQLEPADGGAAPPSAKPAPRKNR